MLSYDILRDELSLYNAVYQFSLPKYKCHTWRVARIPIPSQSSTTQGQLMNVSAEWTKRNYLKCYF